MAPRDKSNAGSLLRHVGDSGQALALDRTCLSTRAEPDQGGLVFEGFELDFIDTGDATLRVRHGGSGPPVLLLHGHPRTHATWHKVAPLLATDHTVVCPDLRGYGRSSKPPTTSDHPPTRSASWPATASASCVRSGTSALPWPVTIGARMLPSASRSILPRRSAGSRSSTPSRSAKRWRVVTPPSRRVGGTDSSWGRRPNRPNGSSPPIPMPGIRSRGSR